MIIDIRTDAPETTNRLSESSTLMHGPSLSSNPTVFGIPAWEEIDLEFAAFGRVDVLIEIGKRAFGLGNELE